jgi:hypothetical protein
MVISVPEAPKKRAAVAKKLAEAVLQEATRHHTVPIAGHPNAASGSYLQSHAAELGDPSIASGRLLAIAHFGLLPPGCFLPPLPPTLPKHEL